MRFSYWPLAVQPVDDVLALAKHAQESGWHGIWVADHFMPNAKDVSTPVHEAWSLITLLAAQVPGVRIGPLVLGNTYRHPAVVANMAVTVDHISGGRLVLGLGAGWQENEHTAYGLPFYTVGERLRRLDEACVLIRSLLTRSRTHFDGRYYQLTGAPCEPKPGAGGIPILIGGGGEKVTLRIVAERADEWNVWADVATFRHKAAVLERHCEALGRDPASIQRSTVALVYLTDDACKLRRLTSEPQPRQTIAGNVEQLRETLAAYAEAGVDEFIFPEFNLPLGAVPEKLDLMDRFIEEVAKGFR
ncbi:MAG: TIGR03560 family F420-dependent LLM class oxidoreductase [Gammaproteobacteria bacterium]|nr:TIGR03560 family F420-dependent LLM class oxidoreductase [Gammaproteobacteria bacterium]